MLVKLLGHLKIIDIKWRVLMGKTVFMFPGQGVQHTGMGKYFYDNYPDSRQLYKKASEVTGLDIEKLIFEENDLLDKTEYTQIALYTTEMAMLEAVKTKITSDVNIGLSLGEYGAVTAGGAMSFEDACSVVRQRGIFMEMEVPKGAGAMAAVIGLSEADVDKCIAKGSFDKVTHANYNCPGQIVISGEKTQVGQCSEALKQAGARRVVSLNVSGPFHSVMLKGAGDKLGAVLDKVSIGKLSTPYVANYNAEYVYESSQIKELLTKQVYSSVRFEQSVRKLINDGADTFIEIGPGKTLTGFVKKTARDMKKDNIRLINIENTDDLTQL